MKALGMQRTWVTVAMMMSLLLSAAACRPRAAEQSATDDGEATGQAVTPALGSPDNTEGHGDIAVLGTVDYLWDAFSLPDSIDVMRVVADVPEGARRDRAKPDESRLIWHRVGSDGSAQVVGAGLARELVIDWFLLGSASFDVALSWNKETEDLDGFFLHGLGMPYIFGMINWLTVPEVVGDEPGPIRKSEAPGLSAFRNTRLVYEIGNSLSISECAGRRWMVAECFDQGVWVGSFDDLVPYEEAFRNADDVRHKLDEEQIIGEGRSPAAVGCGEQAYILALQYLGPADAGTAAEKFKSVVAYESSDMANWSVVAALAIDDDDVLKLAACRLDETTDRVVVFLQKAGGVLKLVVLDGALGERLYEWEFTSSELAEAIAADIHAGTNKIDVVAQDGTVYAFWDQKIGDSTRDLMYVLWQPDVPPGPEKPQASSDISATSLTQTDPAGDRDASS